jgi:uncharacterized Tic20 family protein
MGDLKSFFANPESPAGPRPSADECQWAMFAHLAALAGYFIPVGNILGPLIVWMIKKDQMPFVDDQGKEALNFQISMSIYILISILAICIVIGIVTAIAFGIATLVYSIIAAMQANKGEYYRYPMTIRFIK